MELVMSAGNAHRKGDGHVDDIDRVLPRTVNFFSIPQTRTVRGSMAFSSFIDGNLTLSCVWHGVERTSVVATIAKAVCNPDDPASVDRRFNIDALNLIRIEDFVSIHMLIRRRAERDSESEVLLSKLRT